VKLKGLSKNGWGSRNLIESVFIQELYHYIPYIGEGVLFSLQLLVLSISFGMVLGTVLSIMRYKGVVVFFINRLVSILRGTPVILQLSFVYYAVPLLFGIKFTILAAGVITFGLNSSAYIAEIIRAGIESLPKGQFEAAKTLQIPTYFMWRDVILPQVLKNILPAMVSEVIALLKETALISTIGGVDIMRKSQMLSAEKFTYFLPLCIAGAYYYLLVVLIELIGKKIAQRGVRD
jgi:polar amino acid transport system permease protein